MVLASFWTDHRNAITAFATVIVAIVVAQLVDRAVSRRGTRLADAVAGELSPVTSTRLRLVRRLLYASIIVLGVALALAQFAAVKRVATGILASSAVLGLVVGFAARQTLANGVAGVLLAITQPIRIGDLVTFEGATGTVEDIRLTYTYIRTADGTRVVVPNESLAQSTIQNHTIADPRVRVEISVWLDPGADVIRALAVLRTSEELDVAVADVEKDGVRVAVGTWAERVADRGAIAAGLRAICLERLRSEGLSSGAGA
ncbi:MAG TPA: mechanosensitive ion channel domain-containing protein [Thermoleophilaceae bacterium]|nr:mechanosensitive ion channel domain-containing protein [Thermoleophilaceae bacterium]